MHFQEIKSIKYVGEKETYDLKVPLYHNFILENGIITHNSGKTVLGAAICYYLAYNQKKKRSLFNLNYIVWTPKQFERVVNTAPPHSAILFDEFVLAGLGTEAMTKVQNTIKKYFTLIRKRQLYIVLIIPYIFLLSSYFAVARTRALIHVTSPDGIKRGYFKFYSYTQKKDLFFYGKKQWKYSKKYSFMGYSKVKELEEMGIDSDIYDRKKDKATQSIMDDENKAQRQWINRFYSAVDYIRRKDDKLQWKEMPDSLSINMSWMAIQRGYSRYVEDRASAMDKLAAKKRRDFNVSMKELSE